MVRMSSKLPHSGSDLVTDYGPMIYYYYVYKNRGIRAAALEMKLSHSAVSVQIRKLIDQYGPLFSPRPTWSPTTVGEYVFQRTAKPLFELLNANRDAFAAHGPRITCAGSGYILDEYVVRLLGALLRQIPNLCFELRNGRRDDVEAWVADRVVNIAILTVDEPPPGLVWHELLTAPMVLLVPKGRKFRREDLFSTAEPPLPLACPPACESVSRAWHAYVEKNGRRWIPSYTTQESASIPGIVAKCGAMGPCVGVRSLLQHPGVTAIPLEDAPRLKIGALCAGQPSPIVEQLLTIIAAAAAALRH